MRGNGWARSDWHHLSAAALRSGRGLDDAARAWRAAHASPNNPEGRSPEAMARNDRSHRIGALLRQGTPFHQAVAIVDGRRSRPPRWRDDAPTRERRRNPDAERTRTLLLAAAAAAGLWWLHHHQAPAATALGEPTAPRASGV